MAEVIKLITPRGTLEWVTIDGEGKENLSGKMQYLANIVLDPQNVDTHKAVIDELDAYWAENKPADMGKRKAKSMGYYLHDPLLDDNGDKVLDDEDKVVYDPKGRVHLTFKTGTTFASGDPKVVKIYSAKNKIVSLGETKIGNGTEGHISGAYGIYANVKNKKTIDAGVTLYLNAIQIKKLVEFTGGDDGFGTSDEEGGFTGVDEDAGFEGVESKPTPRL